MRDARRAIKLAKDNGVKVAFTISDPFLVGMHRELFWELIEGPVSFVDTRNNRREGRAHLKPVQTVAAGVPFGRPYMAPFAVR